VLLVVAVLGLSALLGAPALAAAQGPIKIGFISPLSGAIAQAGKLEVILEDNEGLPATALTKARKLVENDKVNMLAGVILSNVAYALVPYVEAQGIPTISTGARMISERR
jgi:branched-chain amino acid transport system substrate-binding protein